MAAKPFFITAAETGKDVKSHQANESTCYRQKLGARGGHTEFYLSPSLFSIVTSSFLTFTMVIM
jgi:hypothetical protein